MNRLIDAFLELPAWQGAAIIAAAVIGAMYAGWRMFVLGYRLGRREAGIRR